MPVHPEFEIMARIPTSMESVDGGIEPWCELIVEIERGGGTARGDESSLQLTRAAGEAILEVVNKALHPWSGVTIRENIWQELDEVMDRLMAGTAYSNKAIDKGQAQGLAIALAIFVNPLEPNVDAIRDEAVERWEARPEPEPGGDDDGDLPFG